MAVTIGDKTYLTVSDVAKRWGVTAKTVGSYINEGLIPEPDVVQQGLRPIRVFSDEYLRRAEELLARRAAAANRKNQRSAGRNKR